MFSKTSNFILKLLRLRKYDSQYLKTFYAMVTLISNKKILTKFYIYACCVNILLRLLVCWRIIRSFSALILASTLSSLYIQIVDKMHKWHALWSLFSLYVVPSVMISSSSVIFTQREGESTFSCFNFKLHLSPCS